MTELSPNEAIYQLGFSAGWRAHTDKKAQEVISMKSDTEKIIITSVCNFFMVTAEQMCLRSRKRKIVLPRQICMHFLYKYTRLSFKDIGLRFGYDHTTVIHSKDTVISLLESNNYDVVSAVAFIENVLQENNIHVPSPPKLTQP